MATKSKPKNAGSIEEERSLVLQEVEGLVAAGLAIRSGIVRVD